MYDYEIIKESHTHARSIKTVCINKSVFINVILVAGADGDEWVVLLTSSRLLFLHHSE